MKDDGGLSSISWISLGVQSPGSSLAMRITVLRLSSSGQSLVNMTLQPAVGLLKLRTAESFRDLTNHMLRLFPPTHVLVLDSQEEA